MPEAEKIETQEEKPENEEVVDVEVEEESTETEQKPEKPPETEEKVESKEKTDELEDYSEGVQKRINKLTAKMREAERREQAAIDYAKGLQSKLSEAEKKGTTLDTSYMTEFETRVKTQEQLLKDQLKRAIDSGDVDAQVEAQKQLAKVAHDNERLSYVKQQQEEKSKEEPKQEQTTAQAQQKAPPDPKATAWASRNTWFGQDEPMTLTAFSIHKTLVEQEGYDTTSDQYYEELDSRMRTQFPHKFEEKPKTPTRPTVMSGSNKNATANRKTIKLSQSELAIAKKLGVSPKQYAQQVALMNKDR
tara:strand:+ start:241 stop:1152 length:912 start_codon:yes stop_codon:yes gene_type:complete